MKVYVFSTACYGGYELFDRYPLLKKYGFELVGHSRHQMAYITLNDLNDILKLIAELDVPVIMSYDHDNGTYSLEIYDDCRENRRT